MLNVPLYTFILFILAERVTGTCDRMPSKEFTFHFLPTYRQNDGATHSLIVYILTLVLVGG